MPVVGAVVSADSVCAEVVTWDLPAPDDVRVRTRANASPSDASIPNRGAHRAQSRPVEAYVTAWTTGAASRAADLAQALGRPGQRRLHAAEVLDQGVRSVTPGRGGLPPAGARPGRPAPRRACPGRGRAPATPATTLPRSDWWSNEPSPVITRSAASSAASSPIAALTRPMPDSHRPPQREDRRAEAAGRAGAGQRAPARAGSRAGPAPGRRRTAPARRRAAARPRGWRPSAGRRRCWRRAARSAGCPRRSRRPARRRAAGARRPARRTAASAAPPYGRASPAPSSGAAPSAASIPAPPSLVAEPPRPTTTRRAPASTAAASSSAQPVRRGGLGVPLGLGEQVQAARLRALDVRRAVVGDSTSAPTGRPSGSAVGTGTRRPPSALGEHLDEARAAVGERPAVPARRPGPATASPSATASAASGAVSVPANLSGQTQTRAWLSSVTAHSAASRPVARRRRWDHGVVTSTWTEPAQHGHRPAAARPGQRPGVRARRRLPGRPARRPATPTWSRAPRAAKAALGDRVVRPRPPLPARRGHPVRRRHRRLVQARPRGRGPARRGVHRVLRRALHGRERRHPHRRPTQQVILPDLAAGCSMADMAVLAPGRDGLGACSSDARRRRRRRCRSPT